MLFSENCIHDVPWKGLNEAEKNEIIVLKAQSTDTAYFDTFCLPLVVCLSL